MKTLFTAALICFALSASAQKHSTDFHIYFPCEVQIVQLDDTDNQLWAENDVIKIRVRHGETPLHLIVATDSTRHNLVLIASQKKKVLANWEGVDLVLE